MGSFPALLLLLALPGSCMPGEDTHMFLQVEGDTFRANCSYDVHKHLHKKKFWCKEQPEKYCPGLPLRFPSEEGLNPNRAQYRPVQLKDFGGGWFSVSMAALRREDSGTYQCGVWVDLKQILLQRIQMVVSPTGEKQELDASPTDASKKDKRTLYAVMVLSSILATTALIAIVTLLITSYIRRKRAGKEMDFGRHPGYRKGVQQKDGRKNTNRSSNGDKNDCTTYAVLRHQTQPEPEDVTYVNVQPSPKVSFHLEEPPGNSAFSGPVEYATVFFRATAPHSGTEKNRST